MVGREPPQYQSQAQPVFQQDSKVNKNKEKVGVVLGDTDILGIDQYVDLDYDQDVMNHEEIKIIYDEPPNIMLDTQ